MDLKVINGIRSLSIDMINEAKSGNPGVCLSMAPTFYTLFVNHLNFNKEDGEWLNRDRFIVSAGHAAPLLYSTLFYSGYNITLEDIKNYGKKNSPLTGHPTLNKKIGIEATTGPLGEGFATSVGIAISEEYLKELLGRDLLNYYTYVFVSDGDLMEGITYEAASLAGSMHLGKLIVLYDSNKVLQDGKTDGVFDEDILKRFESCGWHTEVVTNSEDAISIDRAITKAKSVVDKPSIIEIKSIIGIGLPDSGTNKVHSGPLTDSDTELIKNKMNLSQVPFHVSKEAVTYFREKIDKRISPIYNEWVTRYNNVREKSEEKKKILDYLEDSTSKIALKNIQINFNPDLLEDIRITNKNLMDLIAKLSPLFIGGSADEVKETMAFISDGGLFKINSNTGKNISYGLRQMAMGAITNGLALSGLRPFASTLLAFSDYMKPSIRLSAMMNLPVTYIFTHDSIKIGSMGPAYQPVEQIGALRSIPNLTVFRPADVNELVGSWDYILNKKCPSALLLPKETKGLLKGSDVEKTYKGAYIIKEAKNRLTGIILATGNEVETALNISNELALIGLDTRVISVPCLEIFEKMDKEYISTLLPVGSKIIVLEASNDRAWNKFVYSEKYLLNLENYGISGTNKEILEKAEYDYDTLLEKIKKLLK